MFFFDMELSEYILIFWMLTLYDTYHLQISPISRLPSHFVDGFLCCAKAFKFDNVPFVYFCFCCSSLRRQIKKILLRLMSKSLLSTFSSRSSMVSGLTFKSLIHFYFIFVYDGRKWSSFILLDVAVQFSQHHLLKRLSFPHCIF